MKIYNYLFKKNIIFLAVICLSYFMPTIPEEKIRVNARIPKSLYDFVCSKYDNISQAINIGLENLKESKTEDCHTPADSSTQDDIHTSHTPAGHDIRDDINPVIHTDIQALTERTEEQKARFEEYKAHVQTLNTEITRLQNLIMEAPDPIELVKLQERNEGLNLLIEEKNKRIEELNQHNENMSAFANYFKSNEPKLLEAPAAEKIKPWYKFW